MNTPAEASLRPLVACRHCGTVHVREVLARGETARCTTCGYALYRHSRFDAGGWLALTITGILLFLIAVVFPIVTLTIGGKTVHASMAGALWMTWRDGHELLAILTGLFGFWLPVTMLLFQAWALSCIRRGRLPDDFALGTRFLNHLSHWCMLPVLMLGILVALVKFGSYARIGLSPGILAYATLTFLLTGLSRVTAQRLWRMAEDAQLAPRSGLGLAPGAPASCCTACGDVQPVVEGEGDHACRRCGAHFRHRLPAPGGTVWPWLLAACVAYIPANVLPIMHLRTLRGDSAHTIMGGVQELWRLGSWDLAVIVFVASVVVPITKLLALAVLVGWRRWQGPVVQRQRTRMYELVEFIGQWSMLDVFVVILMTAMGNFPGLSQITAGPGAAAFGMVVVFTMMAAMQYDPRRGWDAGLAPGLAPNEGGLQCPAPVDERASAVRVTASS